MISLENISIQQGSFSASRLNLTIEKGTHICLMGETGCGKTTLMEIICGLRSIQHGKVLLNGIDHTQSSPAQRNIGYLPQDGVLFPAMTVSGQIALPLKARHWEKEKIHNRVEEIAQLLKISSLLDRLPSDLSGGERQRLALARAISFKPEILCLDEPFSALDDQTKHELIAVLRDLKVQNKTTIFHISHHKEEVHLLSDKILFMRNGALENAPKN